MSTTTVEYIGNGSPDGTVFGLSSTEKLGFYGTTPVALPAALRGVATTAATSTTLAFGYTTSTQADAIVTALNALIDLFIDQ